MTRIALALAVLLAAPAFAHPGRALPPQPGPRAMEVAPAPVASWRFFQGTRRLVVPMDRHRGDALVVDGHTFIVSDVVGNTLFLVDADGRTHRFHVVYSAV